MFEREKGRRSNILFKDFFSRIFTIFWYAKYLVTVGPMHLHMRDILRMRSTTFKRTPAFIFYNDDFKKEFRIFDYNLYADIVRSLDT